MKVSFIIYADLKSLLEKMRTCHDNPEKPSTTKVNKHTATGYSFFTICSFYATKSKLDCYRGKDYMKNFCIDLRKHTTTIIDYQKEKRNYTINKWRKKIAS